MKSLIVSVSLLVFSCGSPSGGGNFSSSPSIREQGQSAFNKTDQRLLKASKYYDAQYQSCQEPTDAHPKSECSTTLLQREVYNSQLSAANNAMYPARLLYDPVNNRDDATKEQLDALKKQLALVEEELDKLIPKP